MNPWLSLFVEIPWMRLRGQVAAARARLETPVPLELVERAEARR